MPKECALLFLLLLLGSCHSEAPQPAVAVNDTVVVVTPAIDSEERARRQEQILAELRYYLERHDVQDEGFDMVARYAAEGDSTLAAYLPEGPVNPLNSIHWRGLTREGKGIVSDSRGRIIIGRFHADTLVCGLRIDRIGTYAGTFNRAMEASGHGS